jgi:hypothetical protein
MGDIHHFAWRARHRNQTVYIDGRDGERFGDWSSAQCSVRSALRPCLRAVCCTLLLLRLYQDHWIKILSRQLQIMLLACQGRQACSVPDASVLHASYTPRACTLQYVPGPKKG